MRQLVLAASLVLVCSFFTGNVVAGTDPGARDSIWVDNVEWNGDSSFATTVYATTDSELKQATIILAWSSTQIAIDSVSLVGSRWATEVDGDSGVLVATQGLISGVPSPVNYNISFLPFGALLPVCTIHWSKTGGIVSAGMITIDSSTTTSGGSVQNSNLFGTSALPDDNFVPGFGAGSITVNSCSCPYQCDYDQSGFLDALDLGNMIDVLFAGKPDINDPNCPTTRMDFDASGFADALDLGKLIDHLFAGAPGPTDPCN